MSNAALDESEPPTLQWKRPVELDLTEFESGEQFVTDVKAQPGHSVPQGHDVPNEKPPQSGLRAALTADEIARFELREKRETLPAPPDDGDDNSF